MDAYSDVQSKLGSNHYFTQWQDISIRKILQFREALSHLDGKYPLSAPFGAAETRKQCMVSSQKVYRQLIMKSPESSILHFDTLATLAIDKQGGFNKDKARALIRLFRPDREGNLTMLDFVKSCDLIYKKVKVGSKKSFVTSTYLSHRCSTLNMLNH